MNFFRLKIFAEVMRSGSVSEAACNIGRTQPAVSSQIQELEREVGIPLFQRHKGRLLPVPEAYYLLSEAEKMLAHSERLERTFREISKYSIGSFKIGAMSNMANYFLPDMLGRIITDPQDISIEVMTRSSEQILHWITAQIFDLGIIDLMVTPVQINPDLVKADIHELECFLAVSANSPLAKKSTITPHDLSGVPVATLQDDHGVTQQILKAFSDSNLTIHALFKTHIFATQFPLIEHGTVVGFIDSVSAASYQRQNSKAKTNNRICFIPFRPKVQLSIAIILPKKKPASQLALFVAESIKTALPKFISTLSVRGRK